MISWYQIHIYGYKSIRLNEFKRQYSSLFHSTTSFSFLNRLNNSNNSKNNNGNHNNGNIIRERRYYKHSALSSPFNMYPSTKSRSDIYLDNAHRGRSNNDISNTVISVRSKSTSSSDSDFHLDSHSETNNRMSSVSDAFKTVDSWSFCDAQCIVVKSPHPDDYQPAKLPGRITYTHENDDCVTAEINYGKNKYQNNKSPLNMFICGRIALRRALKYYSKTNSNYSNNNNSNNNNGNCNRNNAIDFDHDFNIPPILRDDYGAPMLPRWLTGSISHKDDLAVAAVNVDSDGRIGVDLEYTTNKSAYIIGRRILTKDERQQLGKNNLGISPDEEVLLRFSFKEAVYKAVHPFLKRPVDFGEVEINPQSDGTATICFLLKTGETFDYTASWQIYRDNYFLTLVYINDPTGKINKYR